MWMFRREPGSSVCSHRTREPVLASAAWRAWRTGARAMLQRCRGGPFGPFGRAHLRAAGDPENRYQFAARSTPYALLLKGIKKQGAADRMRPPLFCHALPCPAQTHGPIAP
ncbi:hypothetical protein NDU88_003354 [Pleurodeles waltl]|uniref:Uncharacterized protein n=1 Tax=Pleurodeles waltl TaxID=8319 RepID=A0AAV7KYQ4_PLEWA|nr:hypothetical protein NDU88_003354 [Pleurodeles waltl]